jgi:hypothetical protein
MTFNGGSATASKKNDLQSGVWGYMSTQVHAAVAEPRGVEGGVPVDRFVSDGDRDLGIFRAVLQPRDRAEAKCPQQCGMVGSAGTLMLERGFRVAAGELSSVNP